MPSQAGPKPMARCPVTERQLRVGDMVRHDVLGSGWIVEAINRSHFLTIRAVSDDAIDTFKRLNLRTPGPDGSPRQWVSGDKGPTATAGVEQLTLVEPGLSRTLDDVIRNLPSGWAVKHYGRPGFIAFKWYGVCAATISRNEHGKWQEWIAPHSDMRHRAAANRGVAEMLEALAEVDDG